MKSRPVLALASTLMLQLALAAPALGYDNGEGLLGETDDKLITFFSLGVVVFFFLVVCFGSWAQHALEKRKEARKATHVKNIVGW